MAYPSDEFNRDALFVQLSGATAGKCERVFLMIGAKRRLLVLVVHVLQRVHQVVRIQVLACIAHDNHLRPLSPGEKRRVHRRAAYGVR
jgi:hypothetical protein